MPCADDVANEDRLSWLLRIAHGAALALIAFSTAILLVVVVKDRFLAQDVSSKPSGRRSESPVKKQAWPHPGYLV